MIIDQQGRKMRITCCLIGEDSLLIQCGNVLLNKDHCIELVVSPSKNIQDWAKKNDIPSIYTIDEMISLSIGPVDYIFSVVNSFILSDNIVRLAQKMVINYHDSILPTYAGLNSTTWAIINNEKKHGVTWHIVNDKIDGGDIVKQSIFPIYDDDTAFTLNLRCYEEAIRSFEQLIIDIEKKELLFKEQSLQKRSYFGADHILPNHGYIDWEGFTADTIVRINRALTVGHYNNRVGSLKILLKDNYLIISKVDCANMNCKVSHPGVVLAIHDNALYVSTIKKAIKIRGLISSKGVKLTIHELVQQYGIYVGYQFLKTKDIFFVDNSFYSQVLKAELFWVEQLKAVNEHAIFIPNKNINEHNELQKLDSTICLNKLNHLNINTKKNILLTAILIYLFRLNDNEKISVSLLHRDYGKFIDQSKNLFSCFIPVVAGWHAATTLDGAVRYVSKCLKLIDKNNTYFTDISIRYPIIEKHFLATEIVINLTNEQRDIELPENVALYFRYHESNNEVQVYQRLDIERAESALKDIINNLTEHVTNILNKVLNNSHILVNSFCFLTHKERHNLLCNWGKGEVRTLSLDSIPILFEKQVKRQPASLAISMDNYVVSYQQLWDLSEKISFAIRALNLPSQALIGIYVARSIEMIAIILAIMKADCVYVPLDTKYPLLKIETIVHSADLSYLITSEEYIEKLETYLTKNQIIKIQSIEKILKNNPQKTNNVTQSNHDDTSNKLAYIMFTSGTTGDPKGVVVTQRNVINYCQWFSETTHFGSNSIIDFSSSIAFDLSVPCTIAPLLIGGRIVICDDSRKTNLKEYLQYLINNKITHTELTPGYIEMLLYYPDLIKQLVDLKMLLLGADIVPSNDVIKWLKICPHHQIVNEYGPTETTVSATSYFVNKDAIINSASVPIGRPAFNTTCYILDKYHNLCPSGVKGELYIGGAQVTNGYLGKPALTRERFIPSAFNDCQEIIYKTGDLVCWLPDGNLQFFGRNDFQVKIQGYRIELTGIESILLKMSAIQQAVVVVKNRHSKEKHLRAYLVCDGKCPSSGEIKDFLLKYLPNYMLPKEFCITNAIPLKSNEKIDFEALEKQPYHFLSFEHDISDELNEYEKISMRVWQHAFNDTEIKRHDNFFDIGGNSLIALQIIKELKNHYHIDIPLYYLFEYPSVTLLSNKISKLVISKKKSNNKHKPMTIIKLSAGSYKIPLFLIHPIGGSVFWYKQLAKYLEGKFTIYGIQDPSIDGVDLRFTSLEDMAGYYIREIDSVYRGESYCLGGASFGATVAFEMAYQILRANKKIEFLGLFDGWAEYPDDLMKINTFDLLSQYEDTDLVTYNEKNNYLERLEEYRKGLLRKYKLKVLNTGVTLFKASDLWSYFSDRDDPYNGWLPYICGKIIAHKVPGNHETIFFDPNVQELAMYLHEYSFNKQSF